MAAVFSFIGQILSGIYDALESATFLFGISLAIWMWIFLGISVVTFIIYSIFGPRGK